MSTLRQYDVIKRAFSSINVKMISKHEAIEYLKFLYVLFHNEGYYVKNTDTISIPNINVLEDRRDLFDVQIHFDLIGYEFSDPHLKEPESKLTRDEYRELVEYICSILSYSSSENIYPKELSQLFQFFIKRSRCHSIYNPFAGMGSISLSEYGQIERYIVQELEYSNLMIAKIRMDAYGIADKADLKEGDSISNWVNEPSDAVVAMMPWGIRIKDRYAHLLPHEYAGMTYEEFFYRQACASNNPKLVIGCSSNAFCLSPRSIATREWLCKQRIIDTIIELPAILLNMGMSPYIVVLTPQEKHDYVRFVNAKSLFTVEKRRKILNANELLHLFDPDDPKLVKHVSYERIEDASFVFSFDYYSELEADLQPDEIHEILCKLVEQDRGERCAQDEPLITVKPKHFASQFIDVCSQKTPFVEDRRDSSLYRKFFGPHILLLPGGDNGIKMYWHKDDSPFCAHSNCVALRTISDKVSDEYMVYVLLNMPQIKEIVSGSYGLRISWELLKNLPVVINTKGQDDIVDRAKRDALQERQAAVDATRKRLNLQKTASDIVHMLGTPWNNQAKIIRRLRKYPGDKNDISFTEDIEALISISLYVNRIVRAIDIESMPFNRERLDINEFLHSYIKMMKLCDMLEYHTDVVTLDNDIIIDADPTMLQVMMDSVLENARRHGFKKEVNDNNQVFIGLSKVIYNEHPYALISIRNNGRPFPENFTLKDYISKGRFSGKSGRTGLGGYHVHSIAKKHDGFLNIRSDEEWNVIIDVLLPLANDDTDNITTSYDYETV